MTDLLQRSSDWLSDRMKQHAARDVVYRRGGQEVTVRAVIGRKDFEVDAGESRLYFRSNDFLIHRADLILDGEATLPERGDQIIVDFGSGPVTFEVLPGDGIQPWEFSDSFEKLLRVHTKKVAG